MNASLVSRIGTLFLALTLPLLAAAVPTTGSVAPGATLVLRDREASLAACPAEQRERLVQVVEQHLRERTS